MNNYKNEDLNWFSEFVNNPVTIRRRATSEASGGTNSLKEINKKEYKVGPRILFDQLKKELPDSIWVIVIDGVFNAFGLNIYEQAKNIGTCRFWYIISKECSEKQMKRKDVLELNPNKNRDLLFFNNLAADLVVITSESKDTPLKRFSRWANHSRYILFEEVPELPAQEKEIYHSNAKMLVYDSTPESQKKTPGGGILRNYNSASEQETSKISRSKNEAVPCVGVISV